MEIIIGIAAPFITIWLLNYWPIPSVRVRFILASILSLIMYFFIDSLWLDVLPYTLSDWLEKLTPIDWLLPMLFIGPVLALLIPILILRRKIKLQDEDKSPSTRSVTFVIGKIISALIFIFAAIVFVFLFWFAQSYDG